MQRKYLRTPERCLKNPPVEGRIAHYLRKSRLKLKIISKGRQTIFRGSEVKPPGRAVDAFDVLNERHPNPFEEFP